MFRVSGVGSTPHGAPEVPGRRSRPWFSGYRVKRFGCGVKGAGFVVYDSYFRVEGFRGGLGPCDVLLPGRKPQGYLAHWKTTHPRTLQ